MGKMGGEYDERDMRSRRGDSSRRGATGRVRISSRGVLALLVSCAFVTAVACGATEQVSRSEPTPDSKVPAPDGTPVGAVPGSTGTTGANEVPATGHTTTSVGRTSTTANAPTSTASAGQAPSVTSAGAPPTSGASASTAAPGTPLTKEDFKRQLTAALQQIGAGMAQAIDTDCLVDELERAGFEFRVYAELTEQQRQTIAKASVNCIRLQVPSSTRR